MDFIKKFILARQKVTRKQLRLKIKTTFFVSCVAVIFFSSLITIVYFLGFNLLRDKGVESQEEMARTLASAVDSGIEKQVELLKLNANTQFVIDALKQNNLKYRAMGEKEIQRYLMDVDKRWIEAPDDHPFIKDYLENKLSVRLRELKNEEEKLISVTVTDKFGGLAGSTARVSGFYSFDKDWWRSSYARGRGKIFVGNVEYDDTSNLWCLPFAVPVEDESGTVIGIYKASINIDTFFKPLLNFKIGRSGDAVLADDKAYLVYHCKALPFANKFCEYEEFQKTLQNNEKWGILDSVFLNHGKKLVAYSEVNSPFLSAEEVNWFVFVERDLSEIFSPLNKLIFVMILLGMALTIILALSVFILSAQELPGSILQVIKETPAKKTEEEKPSRTGRLILAFIFTILLSTRSIFALPAGGNVEAGSATFEQPDQITLNIHADDKTVINFKTFNIAENETVNFIQPFAAASLLSRVTGGEASQIFGTLRANGTLFLINTQGIYFGHSALVNVNNFVASTLDISTNNFLNQNYVLEHPAGSPYSQILNQGVISGNNIALIASAVDNQGKVIGRLGSVFFISGDRATLSFDNKGMIQVAVDQEASGKVYDKNGVEVKDAINNSGSVEGAQVVMDARTAADVFKNAVNQQGIIRATGFSEQGGVIRVTANKNIQISGTIEVESNPSAQQIKISSFDSIMVSAEFDSKGNTALSAFKDIQVNADIKTDSGNLELLADADLDGTGSFNQAQGTFIATANSGNITIQSSGTSTLANVNSASDLILRQAGAPAIFNQWQDSVINTAGSIIINPGVSLNAANTLYEIGRDWVNLGIFNPGFSRVSLESNQDALVIGSNIFYDFSIIEPGKIVKFDGESTQAILGTLTLRGEYGNLLVLQSIDHSKQWKINPQGVTDIAYVLVGDCTNIRGPPLKGLYSDSLGNLINWDVDPIWTGAGANNNWSTAGNWDTGTVPTLNSTVTFDGVSGTNPNKNSTIDATWSSNNGTITTLNINGYTGIITQSGAITISGNLSQTSGTFTGGSAAITVSGNFSLTGGKFTSTTATLSVGGNWNDVGGIFSHNNGTIDFISSGAQTLTTAGDQTYNNITHSGSGTLVFSIIPWYATSGWSYRIAISINHSKVPDAGTYTDFPVLISISGLSNINALGSDIRFTASDGQTELPREIESYSGGTLVAWVKLTLTKKVSDITNDVIFMYFGNTGATEPAANSTYGSQNVWNSGYKGVWHLPNGTTLTANDSTSNNKTGTISNAVVATGEVDGGASFNGTNASIGTGQSLLNGLGQFTISGWVYASSAGDRVGFFGQNDAIEFGFISANTIQGWTPNGGSVNWTFTAATFPFNQWNYVTFSGNGAASPYLSVYVNGKLVVSGGNATANFGTSTYAFNIGGGGVWDPPATGNWFSGSMDEIRISNTARSASWISAEYNNQFSPSTFINKGTQTGSATKLNISGNLAVSAGTFDVGANSITVSGATSVTGTLTHSSATGAKTYIGLVTINNGGIWNDSGNSAITFRGGITNNGIFTSGSGVQTFDTNSQALSGTFSIPSVTVTGVTLTNNGTLTVTTTLAGTGGLTNATTGTLNLNFSGAVPIDTLTATAGGNTVNYGFNGAQTVKAVSYDNLTLSGSGIKTITGVTVIGIFSMEGTASVSTAPTYGASATLQYKGSGTQTTGPELTATIPNLTVNNANGVILSISPTVTGTVNLISGKFLVWLTADAGQSKVYESADPVLTYKITIGNLVKGDSFTGALSRAAGENVATSPYAITQGSLTAGTNYTITFISNNFAITAKTLTISGSFTANNKTYDGNTSAIIDNNNLSLTGVVGSDIVTLDPVLAFSDKYAGTGKTVSLTAASSLAGLAAGNYTLSLIGAPTTIADIGNIIPGVATWTGAISTDWNIAGNWDIGRVPGPTDEVAIQNTINKPEFSGDVNIAGLTIYPDATLSTESYDFIVKNDFKLNGTLNAGGSSVTVGGNLTTDLSGEIQGTDPVFLVDGYIGTRDRPLSTNISGTLTLDAGGMNDLTSVSLNGTGNYSYYGSIPGFVFMNGYLEPYVGQAVLRSTLETGESVSYRALPAPQPLMALTPAVPISIMAITPVGPMPMVIAPMPIMPMPQMPMEAHPSGFITALIITQQPANINGTVDRPLQQQPIIHVMDKLGNNVRDGITVTATLVTGTGALRNATANTFRGYAVFKNLGYSKPGETFSIRFSAIGHKSVISNDIAALMLPARSLFREAKVSAEILRLSPPQAFRDMAISSRMNFIPSFRDITVTSKMSGIITPDIFANIKVFLQIR